MIAAASSGVLPTAAAGLWHLTVLVMLAASG